MQTSVPAAFAPLAALEPGTITPLASNDHFDAAAHLWSQPEIDALMLALAARRPLLVRGEAGAGKSQIARAVAAVLGEQQPLVEVIHPRFEALDLLYRFDPVARLADAQLRDADGSSALDATNARYVKPGALWLAFEQSGAQDQPPVLLIDEIDKADADLPNALLDVLGNRSFSIPPLDGRRVQANPDNPLLIVITTNEERELPAAFVRRCVVLNLNPPSDSDAPNDFVGWLVQRATSHQRLEGVALAVAVQAAKQVMEDRQAARQAGYPTVGLAEFIDLLSALARLTEHLPEAEARHAQQRHWLERLNAYALVKNARQDQRRASVAPASGM